MILLLVSFCWEMTMKKHLLQLVQESFSDVLHRGKMFVNTNEGTVLIKVREINKVEYTCVDSMSYRPESKIYEFFLNLFGYLQRNAEAPVAFCDVKNKAIEEYLLKNGFETMKENNHTIFVEIDCTPEIEFFDKSQLQLI